ncbi:MAG TPA: hypothetical protein VLG11_03170 [Candidatus Saccharimonadales bacterium]|nr:hypothetical protein [Candidatus Saccharimonadales bacterium]
MDKRQLHHIWTRVRKVRIWHLLILCVVSALVCGLALRSNYVHMVALRNDVYKADKSGNGLELALQKLRGYVSAHMNTSLTTANTSVYPPIQLQYTYQRLVDAEQQRVNGVNAPLYQVAQAYCEQQDPGDFSGKNRVPCIENYVAQHGAKTQPIPDGLYKLSFSSPRWSPDFAGWSVVIAVLSGVLLVLRIAAWLLAKKYL